MTWLPVLTPPWLGRASSPRSEPETRSPYFGFYKRYSQKMDVQMPGMDGLEAIRRIRATPMVGGHTPKILAFTALALSGDRERCLLAGAEQYLSKPVDLSVLRSAIRTLTSANLASR